MALYRSPELGRRLGRRIGQRGLFRKEGFEGELDVQGQRGHADEKAVLGTMPPWQGGGNMIQDASFERTVHYGPPARFEASTGNIADAVGLRAASWA